MSAFLALLQSNRNYRYTWFGQIVSEVGDHFNNIAVFSLVLARTGSGMAVSLVLLARGVAILAGGPIAGVALDRYDRKQIMIASDVFRAVIAVSFGFSLVYPATWLLYVLSALLFLASPFFTAGRSSILPRIASKAEIHTANSLTQTTMWTNLAIGTILGGSSVAQFGYEWAFVFNALSFLFSAACISRLRHPEGFRAAARTERHPVRDYLEGLRYIRSVPLFTGLVLLSIGWASGGGAAQVLFSLFGEKVFNKGPAGIGTIWGCAAIGLIAGGAFAHRIGPRLSFRGYLWTVSIAYFIHGLAYVVFSQMENYYWALFFIGFSRASVAVSSVLNVSQLLHHVDDAFRGRVFTTMETITWGFMMFSMTAAGILSDYWSPRAIGLWSGILSGSTAIFWSWAILAGKLPEPPKVEAEEEEVEMPGV